MTLPRIKGETFLDWVLRALASVERERARRLKR
jgi:hypothetical protein